MVVPITVTAATLDEAISRAKLWARVDGYLCTRVIRSQRIGRGSTWRLLLEGESI